MTPTILIGDCRETLKTIPDGTVHCCVTSPPYWGLRDYGTVQWEGGDAACDHQFRPDAGATSQRAGRSYQQGHPHRDCKCGAKRIDRQIGQEPTPDAYVQTMVEVFREVRRVMHDSATLWLNLGDSMTDKCCAMIPERVALALIADGWLLRSKIVWAKKSCMPESVTDRPTNSWEPIFLLAKGQWNRRAVKLSDLGSKRVHLRDNVVPDSPDMWSMKIGVALASALLELPQVQEDLGCFSLESEKWKECLAASVGVPVLSLPPIKRLAGYAARLLHSDVSAKEFLCELHRVGLDLGDGNSLLIGGGAAKLVLPPFVNGYGKASVAVHDSGKIGEFNFLHGEIVAHTATICKYFYDAEAVRENVGDIQTRKGSVKLGGTKGDNDDRNDREMFAQDIVTNGRNQRNVWHLGPESFDGAHFACYPTAIPRRAILAGTSARGCCPKCRAPWVRVVEKKPNPMGINGGEHREPKRDGALGKRDRDYEAEKSLGETRTVGWEPGCECDLPDGSPPMAIAMCDHEPFPPIPCTVLDPFGGSGTTGAVALELARHAILCELSPDYAKLIETRTNITPGLPLA